MKFNIPKPKPLEYGDTKIQKKFAFFPKRYDRNMIIWLESYYSLIQYMLLSYGPKWIELSVSSDKDILIKTNEVLQSEYANGTRQRPNGYPPTFIREGSEKSNGKGYWNVPKPEIKSASRIII